MRIRSHKLDEFVCSEEGSSEADYLPATLVVAARGIVCVCVHSTV